MTKEGFWTRLLRPRGIVPVHEDTLVPWPEGEMVKRWWYEARQRGGLPRTEDIDLHRLKPVLPRLILHDVEEQAPVFRVRLAGEEYAQLMGRQPKGLTLRDLPAAHGLKRRYLWAVRNRMPYYTRPLPLGWAMRPYRRYQALVMPLSASGARVDAILALGRFYQSDEGESGN